MLVSDCCTNEPSADSLRGYAKTATPLIGNQTRYNTSFLFKSNTKNRITIKISDREAPRTIWSYLTRENSAQSKI